MEILNNLIEGLTIGDGNVGKLLDYAVNKTCSSLISYTQNKNFLANNLFNNFEGGYTRRYYYNDIKSTESYRISEIDGGLSKDNVHAIGDDIGELYKVKTTNNSSFNFNDGDSLFDFESSIRRKLVSENLYGSEVEYTDKTRGASPESYKFKIDKVSTETGLPNSQFGDKYSVEVSNRVKIEKDVDFNEQAREFNLLNTHAFGNGKRKNLKQIAEDVYNRINVGPINGFGYIRQNKVISNNFSSPYWNTAINDLFYDANINTRRAILPSFDSEVGLFDFYFDEREKYYSNLKGIKNPWSINKQYGVSFTKTGLEYFSVNDKNGYTGNASISPEFNSGSNTLYIPTQDTRVYSFYQESENGSTPDTVNTKGNIPKGSSVVLSDYSDTSRLLKKTNELFKNAKINTLINRYHTDTKDINSELMTAFDPNFGLSRGRNLVKKEYEFRQAGDNSTGYDNPYCRVWTAHHQYSKLKDRMRPFVDNRGFNIPISDTQSNYGTLRPNNGARRLNDNSVLKSDGFLRITPEHNGSGKFNEVQQYMFSIENLAWKDTNSVLSKEQIGPNKGRIMWFPPYNLKFSENVGVNWNANSFIGRGEEIYTYTNTVRNGTLDFTVLIDHPSILNKWRGTSSEIENKEEAERDLLRYFIGCGNLNDSLIPNNETSNNATKDGMSTTPEPTEQVRKIAYVILFPHNYTGHDWVNNSERYNSLIDELTLYNNGGSSQIVDEKYTSHTSQDINQYNGNNVYDTDFVNTVRQYLFNKDENIEIKFIDDLCKIEQEIQGNVFFGVSGITEEVDLIKLTGVANNYEDGKNGYEICKRRINTILTILTNSSPYFKDNINVIQRDVETLIQDISIVGDEVDISNIDLALSRAAILTINIKWNGGSLTTQNIVEQVEEIVEDEVMEASTTSVIDDSYTYDNEYLYFSELKGDSLIYKKIVDKVKYFDPAFHSMTPEGFNARLTFLHQCTRQGPTNAVNSGNVDSGSTDYLKFAGNLAFGRAPYCVLRIGDFFNTKICIDSLNITYDNNGIQWDLNPDGIGVQPMFANVSISFKFIGGQDISGPIARLQNAVTSNFYANASIYSQHADTDSKYYDAVRNTGVLYK